MMSREFLTRIGVMVVALGLTAAPLAFADSQEKEDTHGEHGQSEQATTPNDTATDASETTGTSDATGTSETESNDQTEAGGVGIEGQEGTQAGEEPLPEEESDAQTQ